MPNKTYAYWFESKWTTSHIFVVCLDIFAGSCKNLDDLSDRLCIPNKQLCKFKNT